MCCQILTINKLPKEYRMLYLFLNQNLWFSFNIIYSVAVRLKRYQLGKPQPVKGKNVFIFQESHHFAFLGRAEKHVFLVLNEESPHQPAGLHNIPHAEHGRNMSPISSVGDHIHQSSFIHCQKAWRPRLLLLNVSLSSHSTWIWYFCICKIKEGFAFKIFSENTPTSRFIY